jgi:hypothetical protein
MKLLPILIISIFALYVVSAGSSTETGIFIGGCTLPSSGIKIPVKSCSDDGVYYCFALEHYIKTYGEADSAVGCMGSDGVIGGFDCCPSGSECTANGCQARTALCSSYRQKSDCENHGGCAWIFNGITEVCRDSNSLSCSDYKSNSSCLSDVLSLGKRGLGTQQCRTSAYAGTKRVVNCRCVWNTSASTCSLFSDITPTLYFSIPSGFSCQKEYAMGECISGEQIATRTATPIPFSGSSAPSQTELNASGCTDGVETLICGEKLIKLPFFTFFNIVTIVTVLALFYLIRTRFIKSDK